MTTVNMDSIKVGHWIRFRAITRYSGATVWRKVTGRFEHPVPDQRRIQVRYNGWTGFNVRPDEIREHSTTNPKDRVWEFCEHCEKDVKIPRDKPSTCECGFSIRPCSFLCGDDDPCHWQCDGRCKKFPAFRYKKCDAYGEVLTKKRGK